MILTVITTASLISSAFFGVLYLLSARGRRPALGADHVVPLSRGGIHALSNLAPACLPCNKSKGERSPDEWRAGTVPAETREWRRRGGTTRGLQRSAGMR